MPINKLNYLKIDINRFMKEFDPELIIGEAPNGSFIKLRLSKIIHLLFWWETGSWKSVFVLQLFLQMLFKTNPKTIKFLMVDPLRVSFKDFKTLPHLLAPIWSTVSEANKIVEQMKEINTERYSFLEGVGFENIYDYNKALLKNKIPYKKEDWSKIFVKLEDIPQKYINKTKTENYRLGEPIPQVVVVFDEFNALMLQEEFWGKNPEKADSKSLKILTWISEQARKAWIIIILGTQKIKASTVPTAIRWNMKTRICLKVDSTFASKTILWDSVENKNQWAKLAWLWDWLVYNLFLDPKKALRFQGAYTPEEDMMKVVNAMIKVYGTNDFDYIQVNEEYATDVEDLEMLPIDPEVFKEWLPDLIIVSDNVFMKEPYQKILSEIIRKPKVYDIKKLSLDYPSISSKDLKLITHKLTQAWILAVNSIWDWEEEGKKKKEEYFWLNLKLPWIKSVFTYLGQLIENPNDWDNFDTSKEDYQNLIMKLLLIRLNKMFIPSARTLNINISNFLK